MAAPPVTVGMADRAADGNTGTSPYRGAAQSAPDEPDITLQGTAFAVPFLYTPLA